MTKTEIPTSYMTEADEVQVHLNLCRTGDVDLEIVTDDGDGLCARMTLDQLRQHAMQCMAILASAGAL